MVAEITGIIDLIQGAGFVGLLIILAIPKLRSFVFNGNGSELKEIKDNHLHEIAEKLDKLLEEERKGNDITKEVLLNVKLKK